ncbi:MAG: hypothetical protein ACUVUD_03450 [bacterium]
MKQKRDKLAKPKAQPAVQTPSAPELKLKKKNYLLLVAGLATIGAGFVALAQGSTTLAPFLLVVGYCVLVPLALLLR